MGYRQPILFVHHRSELGGAPTSLSYLIHALDPSEFDVHIFCPSGEVEELFRSAGATVHTGAVSTFTHIWASTYRGRRWLLFGREMLRLPKHVHDFRRVLRSHRFALVHLNDSPLIPAAFLARRAGLPVVWHLRSALPDNDKGLRARLLRSAIRRWSAASIAINDDVAASFSLGSTIVPNSVDLTRFRPSDGEGDRARLDLPLDRAAVAYFGFLYPSKGFREFLQVAALLTERGLDATYLVVGGAVRSESYFHTLVGRTLLLLDLTRNYEREAHRLVGELGLEDHVRFIPFTRETAEIYRATDIVVAPSRGPELGRPLIEAAASGVPVVATGSRTGGGVIIPGRTGELVADFAVDTLAAAIRRLLADPEERRAFGSAARRHAEERFDPARNAQRVMEIYEEVLARREAAARPARRRRTRVSPATGALRILFVTPYYAPAWGFGGPPRVTWDLTRGLARRGHEVRVFTTDALDAGRRAMPKREMFDGVEVVRFRNLSNAIAWQTKKFIPPELVRRVVSAAADYDVVHATETRTITTAAAHLAAHRHKVPLCISAHGSLPGSSGLRGLVKQAYDSVLVRPMLAEASLLCSQTDHESALYAELGGRPDAIRLLPLPVDLDSFDEPYGNRDDFRARLGIGRGEPVVMFLGRLHYLKGVDILMEAVRRARKSEPALKLLVVGRDDGAWQTLRRGYREEFDRGSFVFTGPLYGRDRIEAYSSCDVFAITPRLWEETSLSALEAAACGRPIVLTPQAEIPGLVEAGAGAMPELDPDAIATALLAVLDHADEMGRAARELVRSNHSVDAVVERLEGYYRESIEVRTIWRTTLDPS